MKLVTKKLEKAFEKYPLYSQEGKGYGATVIAKYFLPAGAWTWYVTEARREENGDWLFFGLTVNGYGEKEFGYFTLSQLQEIRVSGFLGIERDMYFDPVTLKVATAA